jgi:hypothetical protein
MDKVSNREILFWLKMSRDLQTLLAAITHLVEGLSLETFFTLKVGYNNNNNNNNNNKLILIVILIKIITNKNLSLTKRLIKKYIVLT